MRLRLSLNWLVSTSLIFLVAFLIPGVSIWHPMAAIELAACFGATNASLRPFLRYLEVPLNPFTLGVFSAVVNGGFVFWTSAVMPGFFVGGYMAALALVAGLSFAETYVAPVGLDWIMEKGRFMAETRRSHIMNDTRWYIDDLGEKMTAGMTAGKLKPGIVRVMVECANGSRDLWPCEWQTIRALQKLQLTARFEFHVYRQKGGEAKARRFYPPAAPKPMRPRAPAIASAASAAQ